MTGDRKREAARRRALGRAGEDAAADFLRRRGFELVARNYHTPFGELDVVAEKDGGLVFAEVKTARAGASVDPRSQFTPRKVTRIYKAALYFLDKERPAIEPDFRFDFLVAVRKKGGYEIEHYEAVAPDDYLPPNELER
ncbi:MAG: YraN family protein [candidate division Zixibacteria bacterium]|nr:YraN family protein [candidate division Zixibacteria bacterium]